MASSLPQPQTPVDPSPQGLEGDTIGGEVDVPVGDGVGGIFTLRDWPTLIGALYSGAEVELDYDAYRYFERVLPPVWTNHSICWPDGQVECASFGFADGSGPVIAFYRNWNSGECAFFARSTGQMRTD